MAVFTNHNIISVAHEIKVKRTGTKNSFVSMLQNNQWRNIEGSELANKIILKN